MTSPAENSELLHAIWRMFLEPADYDYACARACIFQRQAYSFYWSAAQAIEKYLKCTLLLNSMSVKDEGHRLSSMTTKFRNRFPKILPLVLIPPKFMELNVADERFDRSNAEPFDKFVDRIEKSGSPHNRYRHYSLAFYESDLHKLDEVVFQIRRTCFPLGARRRQTEKIYSELLAEDPSLQGHDTFDLLLNIRGDASLSRNLKKMNFSFFRDFAIAEGKFAKGSVRFNSEIFNLLEDGTSDGRDALNWMLDHMRFPNDDRHYLKKKLGEL
ncbi:hypothetical protein GC209_17540 [bacterium]|nr:hypothetical protein [bacterium]